MGWPLRSTCGRWICTELGDGSRPHPDLRSGLLELPIGRWGNSVWLPWHPRAAGLLGNTAFFAALFAAVFHTVVWVRRTLRARRGACRYCGYSLTGLAASESGARVCPECGRGERTTSVL